MFHVIWSLKVVGVKSLSKQKWHIQCEPRYNEEGGKKYWKLRGLHSKFSLTGIAGFDPIFGITGYHLVLRYNRV